MKIAFLIVGISFLQLAVGSSSGGIHSNESTSIDNVTQTTTFGETTTDMLQTTSTAATQPTTTETPARNATQTTSTAATQPTTTEIPARNATQATSTAATQPTTTQIPARNATQATSTAATQPTTTETPATNATLTTSAAATQPTTIVTSAPNATQTTSTAATQPTTIETPATNATQTTFTAATQRTTTETPATNHTQTTIATQTAAPPQTTTATQTTATDTAQTTVTAEDKDRMFRSTILVYTDEKFWLDLVDNSATAAPSNKQQHFHGSINSANMTEHVMSVALESDRDPVTWLLTYGHKFQNLVGQAVANNTQNSENGNENVMFIESPIQGTKGVIVIFAVKSENGSFIDQHLLISLVTAQKAVIEQELDQKILKIARGTFAADDPLLQETKTRVGVWVTAGSLASGVLIATVSIALCCHYKQKRNRKRRHSPISFASYGQNLSPDEACMQGEQQEMAEVKSDDSYDNWVTPSPNETKPTSSQKETKP